MLRRNGYKNRIGLEDVGRWKQIVDAIGAILEPGLEPAPEEMRHEVRMVWAGPV
jgi:hypothetical protein